MRTDLVPTLETLGLTKIESKVYLALLENGNQAAGTITKATGVHRRTVYDAISRLIEKGLVSYIQTNTTKRYQAAHPERLQELQNEKIGELQKSMPLLETLFDTQPSRHETVFFRGKKGLKALFDDQLRQAGSVFMLGATPVAVEQLKYYFPHFDRERVKRKITVRMLFDQRGKGQAYIAKIPLSSSRWINLGKAEDVVTCVYGDTVSIISFGDNPFGILIREAAVAKRYAATFELLWRVAKKI